MTLTKLIERLTELRDQYGDLTVTGFESGSVSDDGEHYLCSCTNARLRHTVVENYDASMDDGEGWTFYACPQECIVLEFEKCYEVYDLET